MSNAPYTLYKLYQVMTQLRTTDSEFEGVNNL